MKLAVAGSGGAGKSTLAGLLAYTFAAQGYPVLAIDADPAPSLGAALGFPEELLATLRPIAEMTELVAGRTGGEPGDFADYFKRNPRLDDLPGRFWVAYRGIRFMELGAIDKGGSGCFCPQSTLLRALLRHVLLEPGEVLLLDLYAGLEHLSRATVAPVDVLLVVTEPSVRSLSTAARIRDLARDIHLERLFLVGSKTEGEAERAFVAAHSPGLAMLGYLSLDPQARRAERNGLSAYDLSPILAAQARAIVSVLRRELDRERRGEGAPAR